MNRSPAVDAYIARSADFAQPILKKLRAVVHKACPQIEEKIKWGVPFFEYRGVVAFMAAFKQHASFGFWKRRLLDDPAGFLSTPGGSSMGGRKIRSLAELPADAVLIRYIRAAVALNEQGVKLPPRRTRKAPVRLPRDLAAALKANAKARATYEALSPSKKRDYVEWITGAKRETTRRRRLATAVGWMAQGRPRDWKYQNG
jgi:uncharacterized protein YdeI (YjbR/CyaY-like superfamily)